MSTGSTTGTPSARRSNRPSPTLPGRRRIRPRSRPTTSSSRPSARATSSASASSSIRTRPSRTRRCEAMPPSRPTGDGGHPGETRPEWETVRAVHFAAYTHGDLLRLLIEYGADVDAYSCNGTALALACWEGSRETVQILLEAGANPNLPGAHGETPLHSRHQPLGTRGKSRFSSGTVQGTTSTLRRSWATSMRSSDR